MTTNNQTGSYSSAQTVLLSVMFMVILNENVCDGHIYSKYTERSYHKTYYLTIKVSTTSTLTISVHMLMYKHHRAICNVCRETQTDRVLSVPQCLGRGWWIEKYETWPWYVRWLQSTSKNCSWRTCLRTYCFWIPLAFLWHFPGAFRPYILALKPTNSVGWTDPSRSSSSPARDGLPWNTVGGRERNCWCRTGPGAPQCLCASHRSGFHSRGSLCL